MRRSGQLAGQTRRHPNFARPKHRRRRAAPVIMDGIDECAGSSRMPGSFRSARFEAPFGSHTAVRASLSCFDTSPARTNCCRDIEPYLLETTFLLDAPRSLRKSFVVTGGASNRSRLVQLELSDFGRARCVSTKTRLFIAQSPRRSSDRCPSYLHYI
jgi:hypothetical protein